MSPNPSEADCPEAEPISEVDVSRCLTSLYLQVPAEVADDVARIVGGYIREQQATLDAQALEVEELRRPLKGLVGGAQELMVEADTLRTKLAEALEVRDTQRYLIEVAEAESAALREEMGEMRRAICDWANELAGWAAEPYRQQPYVKALLDIARDAEGGENSV